MEPWGRYQVGMGIRPDKQNEGMALVNGLTVTHLHLQDYALLWVPP